MGYYVHMDDPDRQSATSTSTSRRRSWPASYANFANVSHSDYEFTITFARVDHEVEDDEIPGVVVSRINLCAEVHARADRRDAGQLLQVADPRGDQEPARVRRRHQTRTSTSPDEDDSRSGAEPLAARSAKLTAEPIRSAVGGCVASSEVSQRGGSRSATFWTAIARSNEMNASGASVSASE